MSEFTDQMPDVTGGDLREVLTVSRLNAIQGAIKLLLADGDSGGVLSGAGVGRRPGVRSGHGGRFIVTHDAANGRLYVRTGFVGWTTAGVTDEVVRPFEATLEGEKLSRNPYFEVAGKSGEYEVICVFDHSQARMELKLKSGDPEPALTGCERAWQVAQVTFGEGVVIEQTWFSDIGWDSGELSCDSSASAGSGDGSDGSGPGSEPGSDGSDGSDGSGEDEFSFSDESESDSSSSSSSSGGSCDDLLSDLEVTIWDINGSRTGDGAPCFEELGVLTPVVLSMSCMVSNLPASCNGRVSVQFSFGSFSRWVSVFGNGQVQGWFEAGFGVELMACSTYTIKARLQSGLNSLSQGCSPIDCTLETTYGVPGLCANDGECV